MVQTMFSDKAFCSIIWHMDCIFCQIAQGQSPAHVIWENETHMAFLSIFPNTKGFTVVIPKAHYESYAFDLPDTVLTELTLAAKQVGKLLDAAFEDVGRTGMVFEGFGVNHVHAKLIPLHGTANMAEWKPLQSKVHQYFTQYEGYISSHDFERADDEELDRLAKHIRNMSN